MIPADGTDREGEADAAAAGRSGGTGPGEGKSPVAAPDADRRPWLAFAVVGLAVHAFFLMQPAALFWVGISEFGIPFLDLHAILASNDALAAGRDPYLPNPLDPFGRPHVYPKIWLTLGALGITRADTIWLGTLLAAAFGAVVVATFRPRTWVEASLGLAVAAGPAALLAVNRANNDLAVFLLLSAVVPAVRQPRAGVRLLAVAAVGAAATLKLYPAAAAAVAVAVAAGGDGREARLRLAAMVAALAVFAAGVVADAANLVRNLPAPDGLVSFGAVNLPERLGLSGPTAKAAGALWLAAAAAAGWHWAARTGFRVTEAARADWLRFVLGAVLLVGCFAAAKNYWYRWIFALWLVPGLARLAGWNGGDPAPPPWRRAAQAFAVVLVGLLWFEPVLSCLGGVYPDPVTSARLHRLYFAEQFVFWAFFGVLAAVLGAYGREWMESFRRRPAAPAAAGG